MSDPTTRLGPNPLGGDPLPYVRVRYRTDDGKARTDWALRKSPTYFYLLRKDGETKGRSSGDVARVNVLLAAPSDLIYVKDARMNLKYGELEEVPA